MSGSHGSEGVSEWGSLAQGWVFLTVAQRKAYICSLASRGRHRMSSEIWQLRPPPSQSPS